MKKYTFLLPALFLSVFAFGQCTPSPPTVLLKGIATDSATGLPIAYVTVASVAANNVYAKYLTLSGMSSGPDFSQVNYNQSYYRTFFIRFNYRFGRLNSEIKKNQHGINNDDIKQGD